MICGSVWECPVCSDAIRRARALEVKRVVEAHEAEYGRGRAYLLTLTLRHGAGDDLREIRRAVSAAWRRVQQGVMWQRFSERCGLVGTIRALEVTHGQNGWHPHLHIVLLLGNELVAPDLNDVRAELHRRWSAAIIRELSEQHAPSQAHGADLRHLNTAEYVTKLGLELVDPSRKRAKNGNRTALEIGWDFVENGDESDGDLWGEYCRGMRGARMLTWSRGLRDRYAMPELGDPELAANEGMDVERPDASEPILFAEIPGVVWDRIRHIDGFEQLVVCAVEDGATPDVIGRLVHLSLQVTLGGACTPGLPSSDAASSALLVALGQRTPPRS